MEWAPITLFDLIYSKVKIEPKHIKCLVKQLLEAVKYMHENKVMHRDLKPDNIIITEDGTVKLIDFNSAKKFGDANVIMT